MEIWKIDKNFAPGNIATDGDVRHFALPCAPFDLYGIFYDGEEGKFLRMPKKTAAAVSEGVALLNTHTSGGRVRFSTDSDYFELAVSYKNFEQLPHMSLLAKCGFSLVDETDETPRFVRSFRPETTSKQGFCGSCSLPGTMRQYTLYFPLYSEVTGLTVGLNAKADVKGGKKYAEGAPVLYYGSSITQGACASRPNNCYPAYISGWTNTDYINLGFSGNAKGEKAIADHLASLDCRLFVYDYDHNAPDAGHLRRTHRPLYETFRASHPHTPVLFMTRPDFEFDATSAARREIVRETYENAKQRGENVYFLDGETLFGKDDRMHCTVDCCHPNDLGFYRMAKAVYAKMKETGIF